jgi:hypothetical protein
MKYSENLTHYKIAHSFPFKVGLLHITNRRRIFSPKFLLIICLFSISGFSSAQLAMGKWRTHFAYNSVSQIAQSDNKIFAVSEGALFSVDKLDGGVEFYSKLSGLNGADISKMEYDKNSKQLLIIYTNGNMDIMSSGGIFNIPDLYNKQMSASKNVNQIMFYQDKAYLSCDFGIIVLNIQKKEIADTYYIGTNASEVKVLSTTIHNGQIYALTSSTIFSASISDPNLVNYASWKLVSNLPGFGDFQMINSFAGSLFLLRGGKMYQQSSDNTWTAYLPNLTVTNFNTNNGRMNIFLANSVYLVDDQMNVKDIANLGTISDAEYDIQNNTYWFAANSFGVISYLQNGTNTPTISYYKPDGPAVNLPWSMTFAGQKLFVVPGGRWGAQNNQPGSIMNFDNISGNWKNINAPDIQSQTGQKFLDLMNVAVDPTTNPTDSAHYFVTSYGSGVYEFKGTKLIHWYNQVNSTLETIIPGDPYNYIRVDGAVVDKQGNLFVANSGVSDGIQLRLADGTWKKMSYTVASQMPTLGSILISNQNPNQKWVIAVRSQTGLIVFDDNGTLNNMSDDKSIYLKQFIYPETDKNNHPVLNAFTPSSVRCIAQDKNGVIWVGTDQGPFLFSNLSNVFNSDYTCSRVKIPRNDSTGLADYLLSTENIKSIAIDGANRKWIGTESSGVYLMSDNGQQTIQHFTVSNSPLLSNDILSIAINPVTGEVFFGTGQGIVSYQSDASEAGDSFGDVYAYPNPVRQDYNGVITITGLVANTQVKITDLNGNLVCQTVSNGSIATWDGKDVHGRKVSTGIYLAICVNSDGTQNAITKIMVIN